ncbi:MAG: protein N-lysine methyltransferase family protein, partial [archaeon]|nr:protein N-lysine methyltransferase family protein [archaeon]
MEDFSFMEYNIESEKKENISADYRNANYKTILINIPEIEKKLKVKQNYTLGKGGIFWDGSYFLTKYILSKILKDSKIKNVLELGAGTALPSLACLCKGLNVITTDLQKFMPFINEIFEMNKNEFNKESKYKIIPLDWTNEDNIKEIKTNCEKFDLIIGSELIYLDDVFDDLIKVLKEFSDSNTIIM